MYLPTFSLTYPDGSANHYRLHRDRVEFQLGDGTWRILEDVDIRFHFVLHTEVAKWLQRQINHTRQTGFMG